VSKNRNEEQVMIYKASAGDRDFFVKHLREQLIPFWFANGRSIDEVYGGYFTCYDNINGKLLSTDKYMWSQGRMLWILASLSMLDIFTREEKATYLYYAKSGAEFIIKNCLLANGHCVYATDRNGMPMLVAPGESSDVSIYADCFVTIGMAKYAVVSGRTDAFDFALKLYLTLLERIETGQYMTEPYPVPKGFRHHGIPMIMLNVSMEMADAAERFRHESVRLSVDQASRFMDMILNDFIDSNGVLHEMKTIDGRFDHENLLGRYINPGHVLEDMWFIITHALKVGRLEILDKAVKIIKTAFDRGWDPEYGGLFLFADMDGGRPKGSTESFENEKMVMKILQDWDNKLWWPHSEALYSLLLAFRHTCDIGLFDRYAKIFEYTFATFPNPDKTIGEWIQIRNRSGEPDEKFVALPVKDPFHIIRTMILIIAIIDGL
jgi:N-acylglucosamine 2-epimerase